MMRVPVAAVQNTKNVVGNNNKKRLDYFVTP